MSLYNVSNNLTMDLVTQFIHIAELEIAKLKVQERDQLQQNNNQPETVNFSQQQIQHQNSTQPSNDQLFIKQEEDERLQQITNSNNNISDVKKKDLKVSSNSQEKLTKKVSNIKKKKITKIEKPQITNTVNQEEKKNRRSSRNVKKPQKTNSCQKQQKKKTNKLSESQLEQFRDLYKTNTNSFLMKKFGISRHQLFRYKDKYNLIKDLTFIQKMIQNRDKDQNQSQSKKKIKQSDEIVEDYENEDSEEIVNEEDDDNEQDDDKDEDENNDDDGDDEEDYDIQVQPESEDDVQEKNLNQDQVKKSTFLKSKNHFNPQNEELKNKIQIFSDESSSSTQSQFNQNQENFAKQATFKFI
ncbi:hypothetical protein ABPG74_003323 [Tetrahymena malaccensis]